MKKHNCDWSTLDIRLEKQKEIDEIMLEGAVAAEIALAHAAIQEAECKKKIYDIVDTLHESIVENK